MAAWVPAFPAGMTEWRGAAGRGRETQSQTSVALDSGYAWRNDVPLLAGISAATRYPALLPPTTFFIALTAKSCNRA